LHDRIIQDNHIHKQVIVGIMNGMKFILYTVIQTFIWFICKKKHNNIVIHKDIQIYTSNEKKEIHIASQSVSIYN
jgi:hypothetical protein